MWTKLLATFYKIKYWFSKELCYEEMREKGYANERKCCGVIGGNGFTSYLNESCINCPYLNLRQVNKMRETIDTWSALFLIAEFFCLGGSLFAYRERTKDILRGFMIIFGIFVFALGW